MTDDAKDTLVDELRAALFTNPGFNTYHPAICDRAADRIEELEAENAELRAEVIEGLWETVSYGGHHDREAGTWDSCALGVRAAMLRLVDLGEAEIVGERNINLPIPFGRLMTIRQKTKAPTDG